MASSLEFVEYVCGLMGKSGTARYKRMFGEFGLYLDDKYIGGVCDDQVFIKQSKGGRAILEKKNAVDEAAPYEGASLHFRISDLEDEELLKEVLLATWKEIPFPKPKKKKVKAEGDS